MELEPCKFMLVVMPENGVPFSVQGSAGLLSEAELPKPREPFVQPMYDRWIYNIHINDVMNGKVAII